MKREELKALGLTDEQITAVLDKSGAELAAVRGQLSAKEQEVTALTTERDGLNTQVSDRDKDIEKLKKDAGDNAALTQQITDLQSKYDTDTKALKDSLDKQARDHAIEQLFGGVKFTSAYAKKAAIAEFREANHEFKDGTFVGGADILKQMQKDNPDAFVKEEGGEGGKEPEGEKKPPKFTQSLDESKGGKGGGGDKNPFNFHFQSVRNAEAGK